MFGVMVMKRDGTKRDLEPYEKDYYQEWVKSIHLLRKAHYILLSLEIVSFGRDNESFSKLLSEIEDII